MLPTNPRGNPEALRSPVPYPDLKRVLRDRQTARNRSSCLPCRERKVRCNREHPCLTCIRRDHPDLCVYSEASLSAPQSRVRRPAQHARRDGELPGLISPSPDIRPSPQVGGLSQPAKSSPLGILAIAREDSPQPRDDDASRRDVLENAVMPLLGMASMDEAGMEHGQQEVSRDKDPYADLPGDRELLNLFLIYRDRVHSFQLIIDDLDEVESELCAIVDERAGRGAAGEPQQYQQVSSDRNRFLCVLHAILATGAQFSDMPPSDRSTISHRHCESNPTPRRVSGWI